MLRKILTVLLVVGGLNVSAHQFTPTYPKLENTYVQGVLKARMKLTNLRKDIDFYEISVFDDDWYSIPFASSTKIIKIKYSEQKNIDVFIRARDAQRARYICTESKILKSEKTQTAVSSRICSKIK